MGELWLGGVGNSKALLIQEKRPWKVNDNLEGARLIMNHEETFGLLSDALGVSTETLVEAIGENWFRSPTSRYLLIRGSEMDQVSVFEDDDDDYDDGDQEENDVSYPDVGISFESLDQLEIGTLEMFYSPGPDGFGLKTLVTLPTRDQFALDKLKVAINHAAEVFRAEFQTCIYCKKELPPHVMSEDGYCYSCGSDQLGIVY